MIKQIVCLTLCLVFHNCFSQIKYSFGLGLSTSAFVLHNPNHEAVPGFPVSPNLNVKFKKHEVLFGPDLYFVLRKLEIVGTQFSYRYYPMRKSKKYFDYFIDASFNYSKFKIGNIYASSYYATDVVIGADGALLKYKSLIGTCGFGAVLNFKNRVNIYAIVGAGINYWQRKVEVDYSWKNYKDGNYTSLIYYAKFGITVRLLNKYESGCLGWPSGTNIKLG